MTLDTQSVDRPAAALFGAALSGEPCLVHGLHGHPQRLPMRRWMSPADASDAALLAHCDGPVIDIGCGPGRMSEHLADLGVEVLAIDIVPEAVLSTRVRGASAVRRNVFDRLPGEGAWVSALLADGNIGIGGDPVLLLRRVAELLAPGGWVVADLAPPGSGLATRSVQLECAGRRSMPFRWAMLGPDSIHEVAARAGLQVDAVHEHDGRWFVVLVKTEQP
jgi:SAM-dependent methyltransferase